MKVRWRMHELILITVTGIIFLTGHLWRIYSLSPTEINVRFADAFIANHVPFNLYRNVLLPDIGLGLLIYLSYLFVNIFTVRKLFRVSRLEKPSNSHFAILTKRSIEKISVKLLRRVLPFAIQAGLILFLLGTGFIIAGYLKNEAYFSYPGFSFFPKTGYHPQPQPDISTGFESAMAIVLPYMIYVCLRETAIRFIELPHPRKSYRVMVANQVTGFLAAYIAIPLFAAVFQLVHDGGIISIYFTLILPIFLVLVSNTYWLFPLTENHKFFSSYILIRLLISTFLCNLPSLVPFFHEGLRPGLFSGWLIQLLVVSPITWILYQQQKDKILQLKGVERALVKSKTDLQFLRSQINPHFLFNVLNTLYSLALQEKAELTADGIQKLGDMMRFMLHENDLDFIDMNREIEYLKNYMALQKLRLQTSPGISIVENIRDQNCHHKVAPMLLIPFVENAFKHGISLKEKSWIKVMLECDEENIRFEVRNSMHTKQKNDPEKERSGIGFKNVMERLKLVYPSRHQVSVNATQEEFIVQLSIQPK